MYKALIRRLQCRLRRSYYPAALRLSMSGLSPNLGDKTGMERELFRQLLATPPSRCLILNPNNADIVPFIRGIIDQPILRNHFEERCFFISCDGASASTIVLDRIAAELDLQSKLDIMTIILEDLGFHKRTLIILDRLDAIYSPTDPEQQQATNTLLATLATVDKLTLLTTFNEESPLDCITWSKLIHASHEAADPAAHGEVFTSTVHTEGVRSILPQICPHSYEI